MATAVTNKGQVTIPKPVRDLLGITPGTLVDFEMTQGGQVVLVKSSGPAQPSRFARLRGSAGAGMSTDEIMALTRGEA